MFNVQGFKQSHVYCSKRLSKRGGIGSSETRLRLGALSVIGQILLKSPDLHGMDERGITLYNMSSMCNIEPEYSGRPFGGMAVI